MRAAALAISGLFIVLVLTPATTSAEDFRTISKVNGLISILESPSLAPGDRGRFVFYFNSTYTEPIQNVSITVGIFRYATIEESRPVDALWPYAYPRIEESGAREWQWTSVTVAPGSSTLLNFTIVTAPESRDMPHGSVFSQSSYFVRFEIVFDAIDAGTPTSFRMASRGHFSDEDWARATSANYTDPCTPPSCRGNVNLSLLSVDGILPDSSFGVKEPIPRWPFYALVALAVLFLAFAFLFWVEENPGTYPRIETWWARTRGRFARTVASLRSERRPRT